MGGHLSEMNILTRKARTAGNYLSLYRSRFARPAANRWFAKIACQVSIEREGAILCEALWDHPHHWLRLAMFRNALAPIYGSGLIGVYEESTPRSVVASLRSLPLTSEETIPRAVPDVYGCRAKNMLRDVRTPTDVLDLDIAPGYPTHFFYDGVLKIEMSGTLNGESIDLWRHLARTLFYIDTYRDILDRHDIRAVVVSHPTTLRFSTLVWAAVARSIPVFVINYRNQHITARKLTTIDEIGTVSEDVPSVADRDRLSPDQRSRLIGVGQNFIDDLHSGKRGEIAVTGAFGDGKAKIQDRKQLARMLGSDPDKPNVVVLTSCWPDFPNALGRSYLTDHVDWFERTLAVAREVGDFNWIFKPHPAEEMYGRKTTLHKLLYSRLGSGIYLWPERASGVDVVSCADCAVTAVGSVGFEYPAIGARAVVARENAYTDWGFCNYARNGNEYADMLRHATDLPLPDRRKQEDALIYMALRLTTPANTQNGDYRYPLGRISYRLWPGLPDFIEKNLENIDHEIRMMEHWLRSDSPSYNVFKGLHSELW